VQHSSSHRASRRTETDSELRVAGSRVAWPIPDGSRVGYTGVEDRSLVARPPSKASRRANLSIESEENTQFRLTPMGEATDLIQARYKWTEAWRPSGRNHPR